jgi:hypothetical protein
VVVLLRLAVVPVIVAVVPPIVVGPVLIRRDPVTINDPELITEPVTE